MPVLFAVARTAFIFTVIRFGVIAPPPRNPDAMDAPGVVQLRRRLRTILRLLEFTVFLRIWCACEIEGAQVKLIATMHDMQFKPRDSTPQHAFTYIDDPQRTPTDEEVSEQEAASWEKTSASCTTFADQCSTSTERRHSGTPSNPESCLNKSERKNSGTPNCDPSPEGSELWILVCQ